MNRDLNKIICRMLTGISLCKNKHSDHTPHLISVARCVALVLPVIAGLSATTPAVAGAHVHMLQTDTADQRVILKMRAGREPHPQGVFTSYTSKPAVKTMRLPALDMVILEVPADWDVDALIKELTRDPVVEYGVRDQKVRGQSLRPNDLGTSTRDWRGLESVSENDIGVGAPRAWPYTTGSTAVAAIIAAQGNNNLGTVGVAWDTSLMAVKVLA